MGITTSEKKKSLVTVKVNKYYLQIILGLGDINGINY
jgi:hypothetical protein